MFDIGLSVFSNNKNLEQSEFQLSGKYLSFASPRGVPGTDLHVVVYRINGDTYTQEKELSLRYRDHGNIIFL